MRTYHIIGRGLAGWHATGVGVSSSGGDLDNGTYWTGEPTRGYRHQAVGGALIYDANHADPDAFAALIIRGPMVDPALPPGTVSRFSDQATAARMAPMLTGTFRTLAEAAGQDTYSGLDYVSVDIYRRLLARVPGIRLGTIQEGGVIHWDDDTIDAPRA